MLLLPLKDLRRQLYQQLLTPHLHFVLHRQTTLHNNDGPTHDLIEKAQHDIKAIFKTQHSGEL